MPDRRNWAKLAQSLIGKYSVFTYKSDRVLFEMSDPSSDTVGSAGSDCEYTETSDENSGSEHYFWAGGGLGLHARQSQVYTYHPPTNPPHP